MFLFCFLFFLFFLFFSDAYTFNIQCKQPIFFCSPSFYCLHYQSPTLFTPSPYPLISPLFYQFSVLRIRFFFFFSNGVYSFISFIDPIMLSERFFLPFSPFSPFFLFFFLLFSLYCFFSCVMSPSYPCPNPTLNGMLLVRIKYQYFNIQYPNIQYSVSSIRYSVPDTY